MLRDGVGHALVDGVDDGACRGEAAVALFGEVGGQGAAAVGGGRSGDEAGVL